MKKEPIKKDLRAKQSNTERLLEHVILNHDNHSKRNQKLQEQQLLRSEHHKQIDHKMDEHKILLTDKSHKLQEQTNEKLDAIAKNTEKPEVVKVSLEGKNKDFASAFFEMLRGEDGKDGKTPVKGDDYFTPTEIRSIVEEVKSNIPTPKDGYTPIKGKDYFTDKEIKDVVKEIESKIRTPKDGVDGEDAVVDYNFIVAETLRQLAKKLPKQKELSKKDVVEMIKGEVSYKDLKDIPDIFSSQRMGGTGYLKEITDVSISDLKDGQTLIRRGNYWKNELAVTTDEKVKWNANDASAGYLDDKITKYGFIKADGSIPLTADWNAGAFNVLAKNFVDRSLVAEYKTGISYDYTGNGNTKQINSYTPNSLVNAFKNLTAISISADFNYNDALGNVDAAILGLAHSGAGQRFQHSNFIIGADGQIGTWPNFQIIMMNDNANFIYSWRATQYNFNDGKQHHIDVRCDSNGSKVFIDGVLDTGYFQTTTGGNSSMYINNLYLGKVYSDTPALYWEYIYTDPTHQTINIYRGYDSSKILVATKTGNIMDSRVTLSPTGQYGITGEVYVNSRTSSSLVGSTHTVTFPYGVADSPIYPAMLTNLDTAWIGDGTIYNSMYIDNMKVWNRSLSDQELQMKYARRDVTTLRQSFPLWNMYAGTPSDSNWYIKIDNASDYYQGNLRSGIYLNLNAQDNSVTAVKATIFRDENYSNPAFAIDAAYTNSWNSTGAAGRFIADGIADNGADPVNAIIVSATVTDKNIYPNAKENAINVLRGDIRFTGNNYGVILSNGVRIYSDGTDTYISNLPTSAPSGSGKLWNSAGTLKIT